MRIRERCGACSAEFDVADDSGVISLTSATAAHADWLARHAKVCSGKIAEALGISEPVQGTVETRPDA